jgi:hypothetical protein
MKQQIIWCRPAWFSPLKVFNFEWREGGSRYGIYPSSSRIARLEILNTHNLAPTRRWNNNIIHSRRWQPRSHLFSSSNLRQSSSSAWEHTITNYKHTNYKNSHLQPCRRWRKWAGKTHIARAPSSWTLSAPNPLALAHPTPYYFLQPQSVNAQQLSFKLIRAIFDCQIAELTAGGSCHAVADDLLLSIQGREGGMAMAMALWLWRRLGANLRAESVVPVPRMPTLIYSYLYSKVLEFTSSPVSTWRLRAERRTLVVAARAIGQSNFITLLL